MKRRDFLKKCIAGAAIASLPLAAVGADAPKADNKVVGLEPGSGTDFMTIPESVMQGRRIPEKTIWGDPVSVFTYPPETEWPTAEETRGIMQRSYVRQEFRKALEAWDKAVFNYKVKPFDYSAIYCSPEAYEDIKNWGVDQIDETTRKEIMLNGWTTSQEELAEAISEPLRHGVLAGDIVKDVFETQALPPGAMIEFPLDILGKNNEA